MKTKSLLLSIALAAVSFAADISGKWMAKVPGQNGDQETTFAFKQEGDKLTGTVTNPRGDRPITEGKVSGDTVTFATESQRGKQTFTGTVSGSEIKFKREGGQGQPREFVAKRAAS
jgi:hypothetical protein